MKGHIRKGRTLKMSPQKKSGYVVKSIKLTNGERKQFLVHRLVAKHFIPNPENKPEVNHKWGVKIDNRAVALEWATKAENMQHSYAMGFHSQVGVNNSIYGRKGT